MREVPSPALAASFLAEHGAEWEGELISHSLSPVPEEAEGGSPGPGFMARAANQPVAGGIRSG